MQAFGNDVENILLRIAARAVGLLQNQQQRIGFVHQAQFAGFGRIAFVGGVKEHTATHQNAVDFCNHAGHPAHIVVFAAWAIFSGQQFVNITLHRFVPMALVGSVDGKFFGLLGYLRVFAGEDEFVVVVEGEHEYAVFQSEHQLGLRAI